MKSLSTLLQINSCVNCGSTGRIAHEIGQTVIDNGGESWIAYGRSMRKSTSHLIRIGDSIDVYSHALLTRLFDRNGCGSKRATIKFVQEIAQINPDIVHLHNIHGYYLNYKILFDYLSTSKVQVVWTLHDCWPFTGHCAYFSLAGCDRWKTGCHDCPQAYEYPASWFRDNSRQNYQLKKSLFLGLRERLTLVPVSNWLSDLLGSSFLADIPRQVIHNGIDLSAFNVQNTESIRQKYDLGDKMIILGVASPWSYRKGLADFIKLRAELSEESYVIVLVGLTHNQIRSLPAGILSISRTQSVQELAAFYSAADVFVNPTYEDNYPTVNLEAMACGTPVVTYRTGGSPEAVTPETGIVVEQGDLIGLANAIRIIANRGKSVYGQACRIHAERYFDKQQCFMDYIYLYNNILSRLRGGGNSMVYR